MLKILLDFLGIELDMTALQEAFNASMDELTPYIPFIIALLIVVAAVFGLYFCKLFFSFLSSVLNRKRGG